MKKVLIISIILLFIGIAFAPSLGGNEINTRLESELTTISISTYKKDGTVEKTTVKLCKEEAFDLAKRLKNTNDYKKRFSLFKKYGIIPNDVTREQLRQKMLDYADQMGITRKNIDTIFKKIVDGRNGPDRWFAANYLNAIEGMFVFNYNLPLGLSMFTGTPNLALYAMGKDMFPSADFLYAAISPLGIYEFLDGELPDFHLLSLGAFVLIGFVGYVASSPLFGIAGYMVGYAVASFAFGLIYMGPLPRI
jgi:hypothetical protein